MQPTSIGLRVFLSEDAFNGDAQFTIDIDGQQFAGPTSVTTRHGNGGFEQFDYVFNTTAPDAPHDVAIHFINDAWGGDPSTDRNLYVASIVFGDQAYAGQTAQNDADLGQPNFDPNAAEMFINGTVTFADVTVSPAAAPAPAPVPAPTPSPVPDSQQVVGTPGDDLLGALNGLGSHVTGNGGPTRSTSAPGIRGRTRSATSRPAPAATSSSWRARGSTASSISRAGCRRRTAARS